MPNANEKNLVRRRIVGFGLASITIGVLDFLFIPATSFKSSHWALAITVLVTVAAFVIALKSAWVALVYQDLFRKAWEEQELSISEEALADGFIYSVATSAFVILASLLGVTFYPGVAELALEHGLRDDVLVELRHAVFASFVSLQTSVFAYALMPLFIANHRADVARHKALRDSLEEPAKPQLKDNDLKDG